jgi:hypothetical protein
VVWSYTVSMALPSGEPEIDRTPRDRHSKSSCFG